MIVPSVPPSEHPLLPRRSRTFARSLRRSRRLTPSLAIPHLVFSWCPFLQTPSWTSAFTTGNCFTLPPFVDRSPNSKQLFIPRSTFYTTLSNHLLCRILDSIDIKPDMIDPVLVPIGHWFRDSDDIRLVAFNDRTCNPFYARPIYVHPGVYVLCPTAYPYNPQPWDLFQMASTRPICAILFLRPIQVHNILLDNATFDSHLRMLISSSSTFTHILRHEAINSQRLILLDIIQQLDPRLSTTKPRSINFTVNRFPQASNSIS
eukprot:jgi/Psemu1/17047/gm1.17047_g